MELTPSQRRLLVGGALFVLVAGLALGWSYSAIWFGSGAGEGLATMHVEVVDPAGHDLWNRSVELSRVSALGALEAAGEAGGFPVETEVTDGYERVASVNGTRSTQDAEWTYRVLRDGSWCWGDRPAGERPVRNADAVHWRWMEGTAPRGCSAAR